jgi:alanyl-tRNA synthetase
MITRKELIKKYVDFFKSQAHKEIPSSSLVPENDPTVLFTTAGMHPLVPFLLGEKHPLGKRIVNVQRCVRTGDIDSVGDSYHHTFFEMLGNWSLGDYFKEDAIKMTFEFHTKVLGISLDRYAVSVFRGDSDAPKDEESARVWEKIGIKKSRIAFLPKEDNWWGPAGETGPCGPCTEQFYWKPNNVPAPKVFNPEDNNWVEIGNDVLMEYTRENNGKYVKAKQKNIDFGGGVERTLAVLNNLDDNYLSEVWLPLIKEIEKLSSKKYKGNEKFMRIVADHIKAAVFIISDGVLPSNTERGYVLRRLIRRAVVNLKNLAVSGEFLTESIARRVFEIYDDCDSLTFNKEKIIEILKKEEAQFEKTIEKGLREFEKMSEKKFISGKEAFLLFQSYGFPIEMTGDLAKDKKISVDFKGFDEEMKRHQELSRTSSSGMFKSGLADNTEKTTRLHTVTHLLNSALKVVLKNKDIKQKGSNINPERLRFDFNFDRKLTENEIVEIEKWINGVVKRDLVVERREMKLNDAISLGAQAEFGTKYPDVVSVYTIMGNNGEVISREICTGPHVSRTSEIGTFKIIKEESSSAGVRRIKGVVE